MNEELDPVWYAIFSDKIEGPFTLEELALDWRLTPETLMRLEGESAFLPAWDFPLIRAVLKIQEKEKKSLQLKTEEKLENRDEVIVLDRSLGPNFFWYLLLVLIMIGFVILRYIQTA